MPYHITGKVLLRCGLLQTESSITTTLNKNFFSFAKIRKRVKEKSFCGVNVTEVSTLILTPHFSNTMLYAVLFVQYVWEYAGVGAGNLFFFGGGEKRERKSSFAVFGFGAGGADCKCAFSFAVDFITLFVNKH